MDKNVKGYERKLGCYRALSLMRQVRNKCCAEILQQYISVEEKGLPTPNIINWEANCVFPRSDI